MSQVKEYLFANVQGVYLPLEGGDTDVVSARRSVKMTNVPVKVKAACARQNAIPAIVPTNDNST